MRRLLIAACVALIFAVDGVPARAAIAYPGSMASTGDSITRAYDIGWCCFLSDSPQYSWSTGNNSTVNSQYLRLLALNGAIANHQYNFAKTGTNMADLDRQVKLAAGQTVNGQAGAPQPVDYLTILMGANDLCTSSISTMTPTATFQSEIQQALTDFFALDPNAHVYLSSLPDLYQLWYVLRNNSSAKSAWKTFNICQSLLSSSNTEANRQAVVTQETADNQALATVCAQFANCRWDNYAGYNFKFPAGDISTVDYFHPNVQGQNDIASVTWKASYWGS